MNTNIKYQQENPLDKFLKYFSMAIAVGFILCGLFFMTVAHEILAISKVNAMALSILLTGYGFYRGIIIQQKYDKHPVHHKDQE